MITLYGLQMTQKLTDFLNSQHSMKHATQTGTVIHLLLKNIIIDNDKEVGDTNIINQIKEYTELKRYFTSSAKTEVSIAGIINGIFISRRIDRILIDDTNKTIDCIDYKTDINKTAFIDKYAQQLNEYAQLLRSAYPGYKINGYILWIQDWQLQQIVSL